MAGDGAQGAPLDLQKDNSTSLKIASASHEVKNFAESLTNLVYLLQQNPNLDDDARKYVHLIEDELEHMRYVITQMLERYHQIANPVPVSVASILDTVLQFHGEKITSKNIQVEKRYECDGMVNAVGEDLREVFSSLIVNALQALPPKGKLSVHISPGHHWSNPKAAGVQVVVADNGVGIAPEHKSKVFRQSFTTKGTEGNGLASGLLPKSFRNTGELSVLEAAVSKVALAPRSLCSFSQNPQRIVNPPVYSRECSKKTCRKEGRCAFCLRGKIALFRAGSTSKIIGC